MTGAAQAGEGEGVRRVVEVGVVDDDVLRGDVGTFGDAQRPGGPVPDHGQVAADAEDDLLAVAERDDRLGRLLATLQRVERTVVEDRAVLVDLHQRRAAVRGSRLQHLAEVLAVGVDRAGDEGRLGAERQRHRVERLVERPHRRRLGDLAQLRGRRVLALGQPVDPVVEQQDGDVDVAAQRMQQVVAADRQRVPVAGDHEHRQVLPGRRDAGGDRRGAAMDRVHAVRVDVVGEPRRAADAGDDHGVLALDAELGHEALEGGEHGVVTAAGTPADLLVGDEVLAVQWLEGERHVGEATADRGPVLGGGHWRAPSGVGAAAAGARPSTSRTISNRSASNSSTEIGRPRTRE
ncbi:hypothetical protein SDC9_74048 [bioreactor metagenome]|uniref:Uncharacterized protein n=1 Tax=bioreactor metagenome TaxID=1076179 RepID=A0A644YGA4_9ZZZZ